MNLKFVPGIVLCGAVAACSTEQPSLIVDGPRSVSFSQDLAACEALSLQREATNSATVSNAVAGALIGAADADDGDELEDGLIGAAVGGAFGRWADTSETKKQRRAIVVSCLRGRGHKVVG